jgi:integrase
LVFSIYGRMGQPLSTKRASRYISAIGRAANIVTDKAAGRYATAHDLRRSFGSRWARHVTPAILRELMRHSSINTTMSYYASQTAEDVSELLRSAMGTNLGTIALEPVVAVDIDADEKHVTIRT